MLRALVPHTAPRLHSMVGSGRGRPNNGMRRTTGSRTGDGANRVLCKCGLPFNPDSLRKHLKGNHCPVQKKAAARASVAASGQLTMDFFGVRDKPPPPPPPGGSNENSASEANAQQGRLVSAGGSADPGLISAGAANAGSAATNGTTGHQAIAANPSPSTAPIEPVAADELGDGQELDLVDDEWMKTTLLSIDKLYCGTDPATGNPSRRPMCLAARKNPSACACAPAHKNTTWKNFFVDPPNPLMAGLDSADPALYWRKRHYIWYPEFFFHPQVKHIPCPGCKSVAGVIKKGWNAPVSVSLLRVFLSHSPSLFSAWSLRFKTATILCASDTNARIASASSTATTRTFCVSCRRRFS